MSDTLELVPGCFVKVLTMSSSFTLVLAGKMPLKMSKHSWETTLSSF